MDGSTMKVAPKLKPNVEIPFVVLPLPPPAGHGVSQNAVIA